MRKLCRQYIKERRKHLVIYLGIGAIFAMVFFLYDVRLAAVAYAFLLALVWAALFAAWDFIGYARRERDLFHNMERIVTDCDGMPEPENSAEERYQEIIRRLYDEKVDMESRSRIRKREMADYYGMWVHQIKNPIAALRLLTQTCESQAKEENLPLLRNMKMEIFRIEQYVGMVLTYLRMEDMSADLSFERYQIDDILRQAIRKYSQLFILKRISLQYEGIGEEVLTDEKWLLFVIEQVLSNALKYTKEGSIRIYKEGSELVIEDTGIGIQAEDLPRVFEKGFTGYNGRGDKKSTGIGLYLCKTILDKLRHRIRIESEVGVGTRVYLYLEREELRPE